MLERGLHLLPTQLHLSAFSLQLINPPRHHLLTRHRLLMLGAQALTPSKEFLIVPVRQQESTGNDHEAG